MPTLTEVRLFANGTHAVQCLVILNVGTRLKLDARATRALLTDAAANLRFAMGGCEW